MRIEINKNTLSFRDNKKVYYLNLLFKKDKRLARGLTKSEANKLAEILLDYVNDKI